MYMCVSVFTRMCMSVDKWDVILSQKENQRKKKLLAKEKGNKLPRWPRGLNTNWPWPCGEGVGVWGEGVERREGGVTWRRCSILVWNFLFLLFERFRQVVPTCSFLCCRWKDVWERWWIVVGFLRVIYNHTNAICVWCFGAYFKVSGILLFLVDASRRLNCVLRTAIHNDTYLKEWLQ